MRHGGRFMVKARAKVGAYIFDKNEAYVLISSVT